MHIILYKNDNDRQRVMIVLCIIILFMYNYTYIYIYVHTPVAGLVVANIVVEGPTLFPETAATAT